MFRAITRTIRNAAQTLGRSSDSGRVTARTRRPSDYPEGHPLREDALDRHVPRFHDRMRGETTRPEMLPGSGRRVVTDGDARLAASRREVGVAGAGAAGAAGATAHQVDLTEHASDALNTADSYVGDRG